MRFSCWLEIIRPVTGCLNMTHKQLLCVSVRTKIEFPEPTKKPSRCGVFMCNPCSLVVEKEIGRAKLAICSVKDRFGYRESQQFSK